MKKINKEKIYQKAFSMACRILAEKDIKPLPFVKPDIRKIRRDGERYEKYFLDQAEELLKKRHGSTPHKEVA